MNDRLSPEEMLELAEDREKCAARSARNAESAAAYAADDSNPPHLRQQAAVVVPIARGHAREYREEAAKLREGYLPEEDW